ncbi:hypothetical protein FACS189447_07470 [Spirochaetia bacterium]|nr:hypothetical protein FACS189447_07470 [Spirochaetia bacterium]
MTNKEKHDFISASRKFKDVGLSHVITVTDQTDKDKLVNDALLKVMLFGGKSMMVTQEDGKG